MNLKRIATLIKKDFTIDIRQKYALFGTILFAAGSAFIIYRTFPQVNAQSWNVLLWIITIYVAINAMTKTFVQESKHTFLYYYSIAKPEEIVLSKLVYNILFLSGMLGVILLAFTVFLGNPVKEIGLFFQGAAAGILGMAVILTFVSSVAGTAGENSTLMSILALPLMLPIVMLMSKITAVAMQLITDTTVGQDVLILGGIDLLLLGVTLIIFPSLWRS